MHVTDSAFVSGSVPPEDFVLTGFFFLFLFSAPMAYDVRLLFLFLKEMPAILLCELPVATFLFTLYSQPDFLPSHFDLLRIFFDSSST